MEWVGEAYHCLTLYSEIKQVDVQVTTGHSCYMNPSCYTNSQSIEVKWLLRALVDGGLFPINRHIIVAHPISSNHMRVEPNSW